MSLWVCICMVPCHELVSHPGILPGIGSGFRMTMTSTKQLLKLSEWLTALKHLHHKGAVQVFRLFLFKHIWKLILGLLQTLINPIYGKRITLWLAVMPLVYGIVVKVSTHGAILNSLMSIKITLHYKMM